MKDWFRPAEPGEVAVLVSYHYFRGTTVSRIRRELVGQPAVMVDSGAFSAYTIGAAVSLGSYAAWIRPCLDDVSRFVGLDVIHDPQATWRNHLLLAAAVGAEPVPIIHAGADPLWVDRYADRGCSLVCVGGAAPAIRRVSASEFPRWLDRVHARAHARGVGLHGLAVTAWRFLLGWPWASVDSSAWGRGHRYGTTVAFDPVRGRWLRWQSGAQRRRIVQHTGLVSRYGESVAEIVGGVGGYEPRLRLAARSWLVAQRWLRSRGHKVQFHFVDSTHLAQACSALHQQWRRRVPRR